jgi:hypothetical protein
MSFSVTETQSTTFTVTHARHMAAKVATDLKRIQRLYGQPDDYDIANYEIEIIELLKEGYLGIVTYGFRRDGKWIEPTLRYTARHLSGLTANDDDPGRIRPAANISGATFYSYLTYSGMWDLLSAVDKDSFKKRLPYYRGSAPEPAINGYLHGDLTYSAGGRALDRASVRSFT